MKQDLLKQENDKLKKKVRSLTIENESLEYQIKHKDESLNYYIESNQLALELLTRYKNKGGSGSFYNYDKLIDIIETIKIFYQLKEKWKKNERKMSDAIIIFNKENKKDLKDYTVYKFLRAIEFDKSYLQIKDFFIEGRSNDKILSILKDKFTFNVKDKSD